jgi:hypothetical protein
VPITGFFDCQPPTKTYEYLLAGLVVLATKTRENIRLIHDNNGVLISDTAEAVAEGLEKIYENRSKYRSTDVQKSMERFVWKTVVHAQLHEYLERIYRAHAPEHGEESVATTGTQAKEF